MTAGYTVLLAGCVDPSKGPFRPWRDDPGLRLADYERGLEFWLSLPDPRIRSVVFTENSGHPLDRLHRLVERCAATRPVEFLSCPLEPPPRGAHYGYAELAMVDHAVRSSRLIRLAPRFIKANGRLTFRRISRLLDRLPSDLLFAVDARSTSFLRARPHRQITAQLQVFSLEFYERELIEARGELGEGLSHVEELYLRRLLPYRGQPGAILRWPVSCDPAGWAGHWPKRYDSPANRLLGLSRALTRRLAPGWWV
jgi:hypothetical protein